VCVLRVAAAGRGPVGPAGPAGGGPLLIQIGSSGEKVRGPDSVRTKVYFNKVSTEWDRVMVITRDEQKWKTSCAVIPSLNGGNDNLPVDWLLGKVFVESNQPPISAVWARDDSSGDHGLLVQYSGIQSYATGFWLTVFC
jgi:hypothetical protein